MAENRDPLRLILHFLFSINFLFVITGESEEQKSHSCCKVRDLKFDQQRGPHHGLSSAFYNSNGDLSGYLELKLHYVNGDLEVWLYSDRKLKNPFNVPTGSVIHVTMLDKSSKVVQLKMDDNRKMQDKDDNATIGTNKTNYFVLSRDTGASNDWLKGKDFKSSVVVSFSSHNNETYGSDIFTLIPH